MNGADFVSVYFIIFLALWIHGLAHETPPARCHLFYLNATCPFHEDNKEPTMKNLKKVLKILTLPQGSSIPSLTCNRTTVTIQATFFTSTSMLNETKLNLIINIEPHEEVEKISAYNCAESMLDQGSLMVPAVERLLRFREDNTSAPLYIMHREACCEDQHSFSEPCCRRGYTLKNLTCVMMNLEVKTDPVIKTGEVVMMEKTAGVNEVNCGSTFPVWMIIVITCGSFVLFVSIILAGMRVWKCKHRPSNEYVVTNEATTEGQPVERRTTGEIPYRVTVQVTEETKDGYIPMKNLSQINLRSEINSTTNNNNNIEHTNPTTTTNTTTTTTTTDDSSQNSPGKRSSIRPKSRSEMLFDFDKHIPIEAIQFTSQMLGRGQFGQVELANVTIKGIQTKCAVKMIRGRGTEEDERELFGELQMLYQIPYHPNVVSLLGGCMDEGPLYVVVEYCANGSLLKYLQTNRNSTNEYVNFSGPKLDFRWKLQRAIEICQGMIFLGQRQIIHRDLAARNILLDENEVAKISDFGMAKDVYLRGLYIKETAGFLPVRWMAIEAIESAMYTIKSDMWSFGILLWELYMDGRLPYPGVTDGNNLLPYLNKGYRMAKPENCPDSFYQLMDRCWLEKPEDRPSFTQALRELQVIQEDEKRRESEASRATEISDDLSSVFEDEEPEELIQKTQDETRKTLKDPQEIEKEVKGNETENESVMEIGILNRGRSSIDSGANFELRNSTQEEVEKISSC